MISFGNAASSHNGLIPLKTAYKKRGELLRAIASEKNFINLHSTAFADTDFGRNLVHAYKFWIFPKNRAIIFFINSTISRSIVNNYIRIPCKFQEHWKQGRLLNRDSNITNFPPRFCVYKWAYSLFTAIGILYTRFWLYLSNLFFHESCPKLRFWKSPFPDLV